MASKQMLSEQYQEQMKHHPQGLALYQPISNTQLNAGSCGFFSDSGGWVTIAQLDDAAALSAAGFSAPAPISSIPDKINRSWNPKCSSSISGDELDLQGGIPETAGLPASVQATLTYTSSAEFGAILMTAAPIEKKEYPYKSPFLDWVSTNSPALIKSYGRDIKENGLWIIRWTYATSCASINAWTGKDKSVVVGFQAKLFGEEFGPKGTWYKGRTDSAWDEHKSRGKKDKVVVFVGALRFRYSKPLFGNAAIVPDKRVRSGGRGPHTTSEPMFVDIDEEKYEITCEEIGQEDHDEDEEE